METSFLGPDGRSVSRAPFPSVAYPEGTDQTEQVGAVRIARRVLRTVVEEAALAVPGVARMARASSSWPHAFGRPLAYHGVALAVHDKTVAVDLYLIAEPGANMVAVGTAVQESVGGAIEHILGMGVSEINVYIQDVA